MYRKVSEGQVFHDPIFDCLAVTPDNRKREEKDNLSTYNLNVFLIRQSY